MHLCPTSRQIAIEPAAAIVAGFSSEWARARAGRSATSLATQTRVANENQ